MYSEIKIPTIPGTYWTSRLYRYPPRVKIPVVFPAAYHLRATPVRSDCVPSIVFLLLLGPALLGADTIVLVNGDRITGSIKRVEDGNLVLSSTLLGTVRVNWSDVRSIDSDTNFSVLTEEGDWLEGRLARENGETAITHENGRVTRMESPSIARIVPGCAEAHSSATAWRSRRSCRHRLQPCPWEPKPDAVVTRRARRIRIGALQVLGPARLALCQAGRSPLAEPPRPECPRGALRQRTGFRIRN